MSDNKEKIIKKLPENIGLGLLIGSGIAQSNQLPEPQSTVAKVIFGAVAVTKVILDVTDKEE